MPSGYVRRRGGFICRVCGEKLSELVFITDFDDTTNLCDECHRLMVQPTGSGVQECDLRALAVRAEKHPLTADDLKRIKEIDWLEQ